MRRSTSARLAKVDDEDDEHDEREHDDKVSPSSMVPR